MENKLFRNSLSILVIVTMIASIFTLPVMSNKSVQAASKKVTVKFKSNGGEFTAKKYKNKKTVNKKIKKGNKIKSMPKVKKSGYAFKGWYTKKSGGKKVTSKTKIKKKTTLYAKYTRKFKVDNTYTKILGIKYKSLGEAEKAAQAIYGNMEKQKTYKSGNVTLCDYVCDKDIIITLIDDKSENTYYFAFVSLKTKYVFNISKSYNYKTFVKKAGVSWHEYDKQEKFLTFEKSNKLWMVDTSKGNVKPNSYSYIMYYPEF